MKIDATATQPTVAPLRRESWNWGKSVGITKGFPWTDIGVFLNFQLVNINWIMNEKKSKNHFMARVICWLKREKKKNFFNLILNTSYTKILYLEGVDWFNL